MLPLVRLGMRLETRQVQRQVKLPVLQQVKLLVQLPETRQATPPVLPRNHVHNNVAVLPHAFV
ncbi:MAG: hypothetical protein H7232_13020 [Aeromicrobium sp.]|nr:hypothetical protein [Burkholderiales bacterium]